jgi:hypothetical protein
MIASNRANPELFCAPRRVRRQALRRAWSALVRETLTMHHCLERAAAAVAVILALAAPASAADVRLAQSTTGAPLGGITIEGRIAPGDFVKFTSLALATKGANVVWLASPGGNLSEALRIGRLIRQLALEVRAPADRARPLVRLEDADNNTCASACFFLYVAGVKREGSVLGIHKPALPPDEYFALGLEGSVAAHQKIEEATVAFLNLMGAPARYASLMLATSSGTMVWLSGDDIARDFTGITPEYDEQLRRGCGQLAGQSSAEPDCTSKRLTELQEERRQRTQRHLLGNE